MADTCIDATWNLVSQARGVGWILQVKKGLAGFATFLLPFKPPEMLTTIHDWSSLGILSASKRSLKERLPVESKMGPSSVELGLSRPCGLLCLWLPFQKNFTVNKHWKKKNKNTKLEEDHALTLTCRILYSGQHSGVCFCLWLARIS